MFAMIFFPILLLSTLTYTQQTVRITACSSANFPKHYPTFEQYNSSISDVCKTLSSNGYTQAPNNMGHWQVITSFPYKTDTVKDPDSKEEHQAIIPGHFTLDWVARDPGTIDTEAGRRMLHIHRRNARPNPPLQGARPAPKPLDFQDCMKRFSSVNDNEQGLKGNLCANVDPVTMELTGLPRLARWQTSGTDETGSWSAVMTYGQAAVPID